MTTVKKQKDRTAELVLGIIGGVLGLMGAMLALMLDSFADTAGNGIGALICSSMGIAGVFCLDTKIKLSAWLFIVGGTGTLISIGGFGFVPCTLLVIAGVMCLARK